MKLKAIVLVICFLIRIVVLYFVWNELIVDLIPATKEIDAVRLSCLLVSIISFYINRYDQERKEEVALSRVLRWLPT